MKVLIAYFSLGGHTRKYALALSEALDCDIVEIHDKSSRAGALGFVKSGFDSVFNRKARISYPSLNLGAYDRVVLCSPVWASRLSTPVRQFIRQLGLWEGSLLISCKDAGNKAKVLDGCEKYIRVIDSLVIAENDLSAMGRIEAYAEKLKV